MRPETGAVTAVCHRWIVKINQSSTIRSCVIVKRRHSHQQTDNQHGHTDNQHDQLSANTHHLRCVALSWKICLLPAVSCTCLQRDGAPTMSFCVQIPTVACPKVTFFPPFVQHNVPRWCGSVLCVHQWHPPQIVVVIEHQRACRHAVLGACTSNFRIQTCTSWACAVSEGGPARKPTVSITEQKTLTFCLSIRMCR